MLIILVWESKLEPRSKHRSDGERVDVDVDGGELRRRRNAFQVYCFDGHQIRLARERATQAVRWVAFTGGGGHLNGHGAPSPSGFELRHPTIARDDKPAIRY